MSLWLRNLFVFGIDIRNSSLETEASPTRMTLTSPREAMAPGGEEEEEEEEEEEGEEEEEEEGEEEDEEEKKEKNTNL